MDFGNYNADDGMQGYSFGSGQYGMAQSGGQNAWQGALQGRQNSWQGGQNQADRGLQWNIAGLNNATQRYGIDTQSATARYGDDRQYEAATHGEDLKQQRFNTVFPMMQGIMGQFGTLFGGKGGTYGAYDGNGPVGGAQPKITQAPVYSDGQIQQQVNASRAANDQATAGRIHNMQGQVAGAGFGANSPLAMALQSNFMGQNMATNTANDRETRLGSAQANATQRLNTQSAAENQYASRQNEDIERNKVRTTALGTWLGSLGSLIS